MSDRFRKDGEGVCPACQRQFAYMMIHNGFNDSAYAYCDSCGRALLLDLWTAPEGVGLTCGPIPIDAESRIAPCPCSGRFRSRSSPRCPACHEPLSAEAVTSFVEANAPGTQKGWRWQKSWQGLYCMVVAKPPFQNLWVTG
jgi:hypothetical protein